MSIEEKAKELVTKMAVPTSVFKVNNQSKRNALVCVEEIIKEGNSLLSELLDGYNDAGFTQYWEAVKKEIQNL